MQSQIDVNLFVKRTSVSPEVARAREFRDKLVEDLTAKRREWYDSFRNVHTTPEEYAKDAAVINILSYAIFMTRHLYREVYEND